MVEYASEACVDFVAELVEEALTDADGEPDGFAPFTAVLYVDGTQQRRRYELGDDPEATIESARADLVDVGESAHCVAVVWDGYVSLASGDSEAVFVEAHELGRPRGHLFVQPYQRGRRGVSTNGQRADESGHEPDPIVPLTVELMRRHLDEWADGCRVDLRELVLDLDGDVLAFDDDPRTFEPQLEDWLSDLPFGDLDTDDAVVLLAPVARYVAEVLIQVYDGRWDVTADGADLTHVVVVDGDDGQTYHLDPFALVREYADAPLPPLSAILQRALDRVHC